MFLPFTPINILLLIKELLTSKYNVLLLNMKLLNSCK